ncbi:MAG: bifunctional methionine sulfoxide reductase B/A protein [bacterium]
MDKFNKNNRKLSREEEMVIIHKGTEPPFSGEYNDFFKKGTYHCKRCNAPLYRSETKFKSGCGWPSFDEEIKGAVKRIPDPDGIRIEIQCAKCGAHLGHLFEGEGFTPKNVRHCVNSISLFFIPDTGDTHIRKAYFAGGCFWGVEYHFEHKSGVISAMSGYMGGTKHSPVYEEVKSGKTGHYETVEVTYDPEKVSYEELAKLFFEIHDPTQEDGQGPDIGEQYKSVIFYNDEEEKKITEKLIGILKSKGYNVVTKILPVSKFYPAEDYHQDYYERRKQQPHCHVYKKRF